MNVFHEYESPAWPIRRKPALADIWLGGPMTERDVILSPDEWVDVTDDTDIAALVAAEQTGALPQRGV